MRPLSVFLSSTCYDLKSLREHLRSEIVSWGHDPVLSEYPSFPVSPDLTTVDNCKKVVRERADLLVLIVGGKRGSLDPDTKLSVVNAEYREARAVGLDCIVFVDRSVWDLRQLFEKNPSADFTPTVDYPDVFRFLREITNDTRWIFPFTHTDEILTALRVQLSTRLRDLLLRVRENRLTIPAEFAVESRDISRIVVDKDSLWEYKLACELMRDRIRRLDSKYADLESGFVVRRFRYLAGRDTINFIRDLLQDLTTSMQTASKILAQQLTPAFGSSGVAGDAIAIKRACDNLYAIFLSLYEWELDVRFVRPHEAFEHLFSGMHGWTSELLSEFRRIPTEFDKLLSDPSVSGQHSIVLEIKTPTGLKSFSEQFDAMAEDPKVLAALSGGG